MTGGEKQLLDDLTLLRRVDAIYQRRVADGQRPTRDEAEEWLRSLGWREAPLAALLTKWGYPGR